MSPSAAHHHCMQTALRCFRLLYYTIDTQPLPFRAFCMTLADRLERPPLLKVMSLFRRKVEAQRLTFAFEAKEIKEVNPPGLPQIISAYAGDNG